MKIILLKYVKGVGHPGEVHEVSDGYAQNSLIPQGLAKVATPTEINNIKLQKQSEVLQAEKQKREVLATLTTINGKTVTLREKLNEKGRLYHALGLKEIIKAVREQLSLHQGLHN